MKKIICCLATAMLAFGMMSAVSLVKANADTVKPSFATAKVTLSEDIVLKFGVENYTEDYMLTFSYKGETYDGKVENGEAAFGLVTPQYLGETVTATLKKEGEEDISITYSVKEYLYTLVHADKTADAYKDLSCEKFVAMRTLAVDMLNYGAEAQKKYIEGEYTAVNAELTDTEKSYATDFVAPDSTAQASLSGTASDFEWVSAGIRFDYNVSLYFVIKPLTENAKLKLKVGDSVIESYEVEESNYKFRYTDVNVVDFANAYTVKVLNDKNEEVGQTLTYSVNSYVLSKYSDTSMGNIAKAVYNYGVSAKAYDSATDAHIYDSAKLLKDDGSIAEVVAKGDFARNDNNKGEDNVDYSVNFSTAKLVCSCCEHEEEVTATLANESRVYTKTDTTTEIVVNEKTYEVPVKVLYAKALTCSLEEIDGKLYFTSKFEYVGYDVSEIQPFTESGQILQKDIVDTSEAGYVTFKTDISNYDASIDVKEHNKYETSRTGTPYGLKVKIRDNNINVASKNHNGDVYSASFDKSYYIKYNNKLYRNGIYWGAPTFYVLDLQKLADSGNVNIDGDFIRYNSGRSAIEVNRGNNILSQEYVDNVLVRLYKENDTTRTLVGSFKVTTKNSKGVFVSIDNSAAMWYGDNCKTVTNLYVYITGNDQSKWTTFLKAVLGDNYGTGEYIMSAQVVLEGGFEFGEEYFFTDHDSTDSAKANHTITIS